jgi:hypothetical protein
MVNDLDSRKCRMLKETLYYIKNGKCSSSSREKRVEKRAREDDMIKNEQLYQWFRAEIGAF